MDRFRDVLGFDLRCALEVGDRSRYFQYAVMGTDGQALLRQGAFQQAFAICG